MRIEKRIFEKADEKGPDRDIVVNLSIGIKLNSAKNVSPTFCRVVISSPAEATASKVVFCEILELCPFESSDCEAEIGINDPV